MEIMSVTAEQNVNKVLRSIQRRFCNESMNLLTTNAGRHLAIWQLGSKSLGDWKWQCSKCFFNKGADRNFLHSPFKLSVTFLWYLELDIKQNLQLLG